MNAELQTSMGRFFDALAKLVEALIPLIKAASSCFFSQMKTPPGFAANPAERKRPNSAPRREEHRSEQLRLC